MSSDKKVKLSLKISSEDGSPIKVDSIEINGQPFIISGSTIDSNSNQAEVVEASATIAAASIAVDEEPQVDRPQQITSNPVEVSDEFDSLEKFGGKAFYKPFWGQLSYEKIDAGRSRVSYQGSEDIFNEDYVGCWLEPSRIHKCSSEFPSSGRNYFPNANAVVYSRVVEVIDGKNLIVDFPYNGLNSEAPSKIMDQDGIFFFDNKFALESWSKSSNRKDTLYADSGKVYAVLGMPKIEVSPDSTMNFTSPDGGEPPAIHCMWSDAFNGDSNGRGLEPAGSFAETFGSNGTLFHLPDSGRVDIDFSWQFIPATYTQKVVQYGSPTGTIFSDSSADSSQHGLKRFCNFDQFRIRDQMQSALGFVRPGVSFGMPNQGYCNGGGKHNGLEITEPCIYRFEGDWLSKNPNNMKARTSGGLRVEWVGHSKTRRGKFIEMESLKPSRFDDLEMKMVSRNRVQVSSPYFTWHHLASQEWTGGTSTGSELTHIIIAGYKIGLNSNGDFWLVNGDNDLSGRGFTGDEINLFDKIPKKGDSISQNLQDISRNNLIGKSDDKTFEIWGYAIQKGDQFTFNGRTFTVEKTSRKWKNWKQFSAQYSVPNPRMNRTDRRITYTEVTLNQGITEGLGQINFQVSKSNLEALLDGKFRKGCSALWDQGNNSAGHLMYTDYNVNLVMENVDIHGLIRSTARPLFAETTKAISGSVSSIPVGRLGSKIWGKGHRLQLLDPENGKVQEVELSNSFNGNPGSVQIKTVDLNHSFPEKSILVALYSLPSEARFENTFFVEENGEPSYSQRIDYRPQGLRIRQLITGQDKHRLKIIGGRISWYSNLDNRFEPEIEFSDFPHLVSPTSAVPVILNPIFKDGKGAKFGFQRKENGKQEIFIPSRVVVRDGFEVNLNNSVLGSDLTLEGNGKFSVDNLKTGNFVINGQAQTYGYNLKFQERFVKTKDLTVQGKNGKAGLIIESPFKIGDFKLQLDNWELFPGIFNAGGFQTRQNKKDPDYGKFVKIVRS